jgi:hypothetical protein
MSSRFKTKGKKTLKKIFKHGRKKKHITLKKKGKSRRKRNIKSRRKRNIKSRKKRNIKSRRKRNIKSRRGEARGPLLVPTRRQRDNFLKGYRWVRYDGVIAKGYIYNIDQEEEFIYVKTQLGEDGPFILLAFTFDEFLNLPKTQLGSDDTKNLREKAIRSQQARQGMQDVFIGSSDDENDNDNDNDNSESRRDDGTISTIDSDDESLTQSQIEAWNREGAEASDFPIGSDDENDNDNSDNISVGTASTRGFLEDLDLGSDIVTEE